jgi:hypothetical protein
MKFLDKINWFLVTIIGWNWRVLAKTIRGFPKFIHDYLIFRGINQPHVLRPCIGDHLSLAGNITDEYFWQDLLVARRVFQMNPNCHLDIGSRLDGFIAHLASFRLVNVIDIRPLSLTIPNIRFFQIDILNSNDIEAYVKHHGQSDSISCLHVLEHVGLGRYGDPLMIEDGSRIALSNISKLIKKGGVMYLSCPVGPSLIEFNANKIFSFLYLWKLFTENSLLIQECNLISSEGLVANVNLSCEKDCIDFNPEYYHLGLFILKKLK